ncbi:hypothetical protein FOC1_g10014949 [Fusarium oxysporum f. sp. cubense race 1]|uniref:Uncharacterized protein n=1 Tax=Fusarium oxysporum f. sp. cubense (strain race 1) TaxID=1229664 RepID=N4TWH3_FUSC1|nr:hypothetical protein FOC1_g10014949 [Fusarium oxysporum f. sp. cubense race 1]
MTVSMSSSRQMPGNFKQEHGIHPHQVKAGVGYLSLQVPGNTKISRCVPRNIPVASLTRSGAPSNHESQNLGFRGATEAPPRPKFGCYPLNGREAGDTREMTIRDQEHQNSERLATLTALF